MISCALIAVLCRQVVPPNQAKMMFKVLKEKKLPTMLVMFEGKQGYGFGYVCSTWMKCEFWDDHSIAYTSTCTCLLKCIYFQTFKHNFMHASTCAHTQYAHTHACAHTHTHTRVRARTHTHTHTHRVLMIRRSDACCTNIVLMIKSSVDIALVWSCYNLICMLASRTPQTWLQSLAVWNSTITLRISLI